MNTVLLIVLTSCVVYLVRRWFKRHALEVRPSPANAPAANAEKSLHPLGELSDANAGIAAAHPSPAARTVAADDARQDARDYFTPALAEVIAEAGLDHDLVWPAREMLRAALQSGNPRELDRALRPLLPQAVWAWPGYEKWAKRIAEKPTRLRMVGAVVGLLLRKVAEQEHMEQLLANTARRPYWQLRAVGDGADWPACAKASGRVERWDSRYWQRHGPHQCQRVGCRCSLRAYGEAELRDQGLHVGTQT